MIKLALSGKKQAGKSTVSDYLYNHYGFDQYSFADLLKMKMIEAGIEPDRVFKTKDENARRLLQVYGQAMRDQDPLHWVKAVLEGVEVADSFGAEAVVIDDLRFLNEAKALKADGFKLVRITKIFPQYNQREMFPSDEDISENELDDYDGWDFEMTAGDDGVEKLYALADGIMSKLGGDFQE